MLKRLRTNCIDNLEAIHISYDVKSRTEVYDGCAIMASILIAMNSSKPSWNASGRKIGRLAKRLKSKYTPIATPQLHERERWPNIDVLENDVLQKTFAKAAAIVLS